MSEHRLDGRIEVWAPAKLNLFLEIQGRREDGYHDLESLMLTVDLRDRLEIADDPSGRLTLECDDPRLPTGGENLVVKAAQRLREATGTSRGASISLYKSIPAQAGLGGGSSDAAATLTALDRVWATGCSPDRLDRLAGEIGSDVAFFRHGPAAVCRGRGELVEDWALGTRLSFVLVCPPTGVSTADVYRRLIPPDRPRPIEPFLEALRSADTAAIGRELFNRLQPVAESIHPGLTRVRDALRSLVPSELDGTLMSGSGSAYFGLARSPDAAIAAANRLESLGLGQVHVVASLP
ncbi:MAG: 4-(cytidine 5'-diphospho)-2-C-methyl-D-erythritol kinase [Isosphaeraceae bacterium]|nr:4-(cytidine 5'-diphospho)-2-C-methyl-D-erythritol kinase [Isosphaeraceae bacterium]